MPRTSTLRPRRFRLSKAPISTSACGWKTAAAGSSTSGTITTSSPPATAADARDACAEGVARLLAWAQSPIRCVRHSLFRRRARDAYPDDAPTYFYSLFKTVDGNMRAYVRGGGPAYEAGLRTNDVVNKLDGKFWWEYGTYQTQLRAYDGKPHRFEVEREARALDVRLGAYVPAS